MSSLLFLVTASIVLSVVTVINAQRGYPFPDAKPQSTDGAVMAHTIGSGTLNFEYYFYILGVACENRDQRFWKTIDKDYQKCMTSRGAFTNLRRLPDGSFDKLCINWRISRQCKVNMATDLDRCLASNKGSDALRFMEALAEYTCKDTRDTNSHLTERFTKNAVVPGVFTCFPELQDRILNCVKSDKTSSSFCSQFDVVKECYGKYYTDFTCNDPYSIVYMRELFRSMTSTLKCDLRFPPGGWGPNRFTTPAPHGWGDDRHRIQPPPTTGGWAPERHTSPSPPPGGWIQDNYRTSSPPSSGWGESYQSIPPTPTAGWVQDRNPTPPPPVGWGQERYPPSRPPTVGWGQERYPPSPPISQGGWGENRYGTPRVGWGDNQNGKNPINWNQHDDPFAIPTRRSQYDPFAIPTRRPQYDDPFAIPTRRPHQDDPFTRRIPTYDILRVKVAQDDRFRTTSGRPIIDTKFRSQGKQSGNEWVLRSTTTARPPQDWRYSSTNRPQPQVNVRFTSERRPPIDDRLILIPTTVGGKIRPLRSDKANLQLLNSASVEVTSHKNDIQNDPIEIEVGNLNFEFLQEERQHLPTDKQLEQSSPNDKNESIELPGSAFVELITPSTKTEIQPHQNTEDHFEHIFLRPLKHKQANSSLPDLVSKKKPNPSDAKTIPLKQERVPETFATATTTVRTPIRRKIRIQSQNKSKTTNFQFPQRSTTTETTTPIPKNLIRIKLPQKIKKTYPVSVELTTETNSIRSNKNDQTDFDLPSSASVEVEPSIPTLTIRKRPLKKDNPELLNSNVDSTEIGSARARRRKIKIWPYRKAPANIEPSSTTTSEATPTVRGLARKKTRKSKRSTTTTTELPTETIK